MMLPDKLSDLIRVALADLKACEADEDYRIRMDDWHIPSGISSSCEVCFAGAVMAKTLDADPAHFISPCDFTDGVDTKLYALNELRRGLVSHALRGLGMRYSDAMDLSVSLDRAIVDYKHNENLFHAQMNTLAEDLQKAGL